MQWRFAARVWGASRQGLARSIGLLAVAVLAASAAGCASSPSNGRLTLASLPASGATVAFESIDGPPPEVLHKLVTSLNDEAGARQIAVVSRSGAATYRVRGYVSAVVERDKTTFAWVWDVYDADKHRTLRISGEEPAASIKRRDARSTAWAAADEQVVRRMARNGIDQIAAFLNTPGAAPEPAAVPEPGLVTLASARDDSPEAAGIFRSFGAPDQPATTPADNAADTAPPPATKPRKARSAAVAPSTDGRSARP
jgi:hypothetical protein